MKMLGLLRVRNVAPWIAMVLESISFCDGIIILDGGSTDDTREICKKSSVSMVINTLDQPFDEGRDREILALVAQKFNPEWICSPDGDEVFLSGIWNLIQPLLEDPKIRVIESHNLNLWGSESTVRWDGNWKEQWRQRFWRFPQGKLTYAPNNCALPDQICSGPFTRAGKIIHYGNVTQKQRLDRYLRNERENMPFPSLMDEDVELVSLEKAILS